MRTFGATLATLFLLLLPDPGEAAILTGNGSATVSQTTPEGKEVKEVVSLVAAYSGSVFEDPHRKAIRIQFIRPDNLAVAYAVLSFPMPGESGTFSLADPDVDLLYYEQRPGGTTKLFVAAEAKGELRVEGKPNLAHYDPIAEFELKVRDPGTDGLLNTEDDQVRVVAGGEAVFFARGDLSGVTYYADESDSIYVGGDVFIVYDDGCTGSPDSYDDDYGYDSGDYDDSYDGDSCDGDVYDDDYGDDYDYGSDAYDDGSCDYEDSSDGDYDDSDSDSDWDWDSGDSDWDWDGDSYDLSPRVMKAMSWLTRPPRWLMRELHRLQRLLPLLLAVGILLALRIAGARRRT
jgi:hypothetical protein